jgi:hypothetical protein
VKKAGILCTLFFCVWLGRPRGTKASGFEYGANGAEALGRAGAFVARGDNPSALYYNVAGIGRMEGGTHLLLDMNLVLRELTFQPAGTMDFAGSNGYRVNGLPYPEVKDKAGLNLAPFFALVTDLGLDSDFTFAIGAFGPGAVGRSEFPSQSWVQNLDGERIPIPAPQRYDLLYMDVVFIWPTIAASYRITDDLSVGLGFQSGVVNIKFQNMAVAFGNGENVVADLRANLDVWDWFVPAGIAGVWYRPCRWFEMAGSVRVSDGIKAEGELTTISNPYGVEGQDPVSSDGWTEYNTESGERAPYAELSFSWPMVTARTGFRFVWPRDTGEIVGDELDEDVASRLARMPPHEREWLDVELDLTYQMDSSVDTYKVKIGGNVPLGHGVPNLTVRPRADNPGGPGVLQVPHHWQDTIGVRLGGDVNLLEGAVSLHWGASYESSTVPEEWTRLDYAQWTTYGVAGGVTVRLPWYGIDLTAGYLHLFMPDREVTDGQARMLDSIGRAEELIPVINNGKYHSSMDIFSLGIAAKF